MTYFERWKIVLITFICLLGLVFALPNVLGQKSLEGLRGALPSWIPAKTISLGLDLQGGSHLLMQVEMDSVVSERLDSMIDTVRKELRKEKIGYTGLKKTKEGDTIEDIRQAADRLSETMQKVGAEMYKSAGSEQQQGQQPGDQQEGGSQRTEEQGDQGQQGGENQGENPEEGEYKEK